MLTTTLYISVSVAVALPLALYVFTSNRSSLRRLPGPKGLPIVGNIFQMPQDQSWLVFTEWAKTYGNIMSLSMFGQPLIIVSSVEIANELLNKRYTLYSDRPLTMMVGVLMGWDKILAFMPYGPPFLAARRMLHSFMGSGAALTPYHGHIQLETQRLLRRLLDRPERPAEAIRQTAGSIILNMTYGYQTQEHNDPFVKRVENAMDQISKFLQPGLFYVDILHWLRHVPAWVPGAGFQRTAAVGRTLRDSMAGIPFEDVKSNMADGSNVANFTSVHLEKSDLSAEDEENVKWTASALYAGGADTTVSAVHIFILPMTLHPEVQARAQEQIDAVVGPDRLPTYEDRGRLPYIDALVKELFRWNPVTPFTAARQLSRDDEYDGYRIPAGAMVMPNVWAMLHSPDSYVDPSSFKPERFLGPAPEYDPRKIAFGFGRRACPGQVLAETSIWMSCTLILAALQIRPVKDADGRDVLPEAVMQNGMTSHPKPFKCEITPRSERARELILATPYADDS